MTSCMHRKQQLFAPTRILTRLVFLSSVLRFTALLASPTRESKDDHDTGDTSSTPSTSAEPRLLAKNHHQHHGTRSSHSTSLAPPPEPPDYLHPSGSSPETRKRPIQCFPQNELNYRQCCLRRESHCVQTLEDPKFFYRECCEERFLAVNDVPAHLGNLVTALSDMAYIAYKTHRTLLAPVDDKLFRGVFADLEGWFDGRGQKPPQNEETVEKTLLASDNRFALWRFLRRVMTTQGVGEAAFYWAKRLYNGRFHEADGMQPLVEALREGRGKINQTATEAGPQAAPPQRDDRRGDYFRQSNFHPTPDLSAKAANDVSFLKRLTFASERQRQSFRGIIGRTFFRLSCPNLPVVDIAGGGREGPFRFALDQQGAETSPAKLILIYQGLYHDHSLDTISQLHAKNQILADRKTKKLLESFPTRVVRGGGGSSDLDDMGEDDEQAFDAKKITFSGHFPDNYPLHGREEMQRQLESRQQDNDAAARKESSEYDKVMLDRVNEMELHYMLLRDRWVARFPSVVRLTGEDAITVWDEEVKPIPNVPIEEVMEEAPSLSPPPFLNDVETASARAEIKFLRQKILRKYRGLEKIRGVGRQEAGAGATSTSSSSRNAGSDRFAAFATALYSTNRSELRNLYRFLYLDAAPSRLLPPKLIQPFLLSQCGSEDWGNDDSKDVEDGNMIPNSSIARFAELQRGFFFDDDDHNLQQRVSASAVPRLNEQRVNNLVGHQRPCLLDRFLKSRYMEDHKCLMLHQVFHFVDWTVEDVSFKQIFMASLWINVVEKNVVWPSLRSYFQSTRLYHERASKARPRLGSTTSEVDVPARTTTRYHRLGKLLRFLGENEVIAVHFRGAWGFQGVGLQILEEVRRTGIRTVYIATDNIRFPHFRNLVDKLRDEYQLTVLSSEISESISAGGHGGEEDVGGEDGGVLGIRRYTPTAAPEFRASGATEFGVGSDATQVTEAADDEESEFLSSAGLAPPASNVASNVADEDSISVTFNSAIPWHKHHLEGARGKLPNLALHIDLCVCVLAHNFIGQPLSSLSELIMNFRAAVRNIHLHAGDGEITSVLSSEKWRRFLRKQHYRERSSSRNKGQDGASASRTSSAAEREGREHSTQSQEQPSDGNEDKNTGRAAAPIPSWAQIQRFYGTLMRGTSRRNNSNIQGAGADQQIQKPPRSELFLRLPREVLPVDRIFPLHFYSADTTVKGTWLRNLINALQAASTFPDDHYTSESPMNYVASRTSSTSTDDLLKMLIEKEIESNSVFSDPLPTPRSAGEVAYTKFEMRLTQYWAEWEAEHGHPEGGEYKRKELSRVEDLLQLPGAGGDTFLGGQVFDFARSWKVAHVFAATFYHDLGRRKCHSLGLLLRLRFVLLFLLLGNYLEHECVRELGIFGYLVYIDIYNQGLGVWRFLRDFVSVPRETRIKNEWVSLLNLLLQFLEAKKCRGQYLNTFSDEVSEDDDYLHAFYRPEAPFFKKSPIRQKALLEQHVRREILFSRPDVGGGGGPPEPGNPTHGGGGGPLIYFGPSVSLSVPARCFDESDDAARSVVLPYFHGPDKFDLGFLFPGARSPEYGDRHTCRIPDAAWGAATGQKDMFGGPLREFRAGEYCDGLTLEVMMKAEEGNDVVVYPHLSEIRRRQEEELPREDEDSLEKKLFALHHCGLITALERTTAKNRNFDFYNVQIDFRQLQMLFLVLKSDDGDQVQDQVQEQDQHGREQVDGAACRVAVRELAEGTRDWRELAIGVETERVILRIQSAMLALFQHPRIQIDASGWVRFLQVWNYNTFTREGATTAASLECVD